MHMLDPVEPFVLAAPLRPYDASEHFETRGLPSSIGHEAKMIEVPLGVDYESSGCIVYASLLTCGRHICTST